MPPPRTPPTTFLLQSHHTTGLSSSPRVNSYHNLTRISTRPTRSQSYRHHRHKHNLGPYPFLLHLHVQSFSTSSIRRKEWEQNYYEILDVPITASAAEIKKYAYTYIYDSSHLTLSIPTHPLPPQFPKLKLTCPFRKFYALSLRHHPDRNRTDPTASQRFAKISSAYSVLSNTQKRSTYDQDHGFHHAHHQHHQYPTGSHSSHSANLHKSSAGGYAGSRPASGLSNRRGTFRGPPPSFYEQGGYGGTGRRGDGFGFSAGKAGPGASTTGSSTSSSKATGGSGAHPDSEDPLAFIHRNPLHHFNARAHFRTQKAEDERRRERVSKARSAAREKADSDSDSFIAGGEFGLVRFVVVCGILGIAGG
ncbi:uncharacterized protein N7473_012976 [Penicillium subrubescens]|nr:uncharacterized protein N7473_012976 [Penicillium subrubescens]KAJ5875629.1 hypothetical protein N7473_012976 [Penicillium subrubescens]